MDLFSIFIYAIVVTATTTIVTADDSNSKIRDLAGTTEKINLTTNFEKNATLIEDSTIIEVILTTEKIDTFKEKDVTIIALTSTTQEITDFSTTPTEESVTLKESEDGKNDTSNGDQSENGDNNNTSITNPKKRHVYPLPLDSFRHPYIGYYGESQNVENAPTADVPFDPNFVNYYPHNHGYADTIPGIEGHDYPIFATVPQTQFSCNNLPIGLYGDVEARCQVWHFCQDGGRKDSFLCPNGTLFNQQVLVCDWWYNVECESTTQFYSASSQTHQSGQYYGVRYSQGTAYYPPGFGTNKGTSHSGASQYIPAQPTKRTSSYASVVTQTAYHAPRVTYQNFREKGGYYTPSVPAQPAQITVECKQQGNQCSGASYTIKESKGDTGVGYGVQSVQTGYAPTGNVKSGYQYSYSGQPTAMPNTGNSYSYQTGISTPAMQAIQFEPQYTTGGQSGYQYSYSNKASSDTGYQYADQNRGATPGFQYQSVSRVTPSFQVNYEVPVQYPSDQSGFQYLYSTQGTGTAQTGYQNTFMSQSSGVKSGYQYPAPATGHRVPGTKSGYQYSYSTQVGGPGSSHVQSFSSSYDGQRFGYQQPVPVPALTPASVQVMANVKSGYEYTVQPVYEYKPSPTPAPVRVANVKSGYQYQSVSVPAPAPVRVTNTKSGYQHQSAPAPVPLRITNVKSDYQYETAPATAPVRVTNVKSGYQYQSARAPAPVRVTNVKSNYQYETAPAPTPVLVTNVKSGYQYQSTPAPASILVTNVKSSYESQATSTPAPSPRRVTNVKSGYVQPVVYQFQLAPTPSPAPVPVHVANVKSGYDYSPQILRVQPNYENGVSQNQDSGSGKDSEYGYGQTVVQNIPQGGGRCANCYGTADAGFGASSRAFVASTVRSIATPYPSSDEEQDAQIQY